MPEGIEQPAGVMLTRNPGVALVWSSKTWQPFAAPNGLLINVGDPTRTLWFAEGRDATHDEVDASIQSGLPLLMDLAMQEGPAAVAQLAGMTARVLPLLPEPTR